MKRRDDGWCAALDRDTLLCRIYEQRPLVCRELEVGSPECLAERNGSAGISESPSPTRLR
jgi:Fe-S-cluster containining protein